MRMVPNSPYDTGSQAEKLLFDRLRHAFDDRYVAYHSPKPTRHPSKRFPDYVICGPEGLYVLEVKGGRIACHEGVWEYQDRYGSTDRFQESPFRQAETALHGLMQDLRAHLPADAVARLVTGYGVVFPDCEWRTHGTEWDPEMLADKRRSRDMESWLRGLFAYCQARSGRQALPDDDALERLQKHLRSQVDTPASEAEATPPDQVEGGRLRVEEITGRLTRLFEKADGSRCDDLILPGFPGLETTKEDWLDAELPDFGLTPRQMLNSDDEGHLFLLDRFVNAIATSRVASHPYAVRDIVRQRIETMFRDGLYLGLIGGPQMTPDDEPRQAFERWMNTVNPMFGDITPRQFFEGVEVEVERLRVISSRLDAIDDGAFS